MAAGREGLKGGWGGARRGDTHRTHWSRGVGPAAERSAPGAWMARGDTAPINSRCVLSRSSLVIKRVSVSLGDPVIFLTERGFLANHRDSSFR